MRILPRWDSLAEALATERRTTGPEGVGSVEAEGGVLTYQEYSLYSGTSQRLVRCPARRRDYPFFLRQLKQAVSKGDFYDRGWPAQASKAQKMVVYPFEIQVRHALYDES